MDKKLYILSIIPLVFPVISREDIIPWIISIFFIYKSIKEIDKNESSISKVAVNITFAGSGILLFNMLSSVIEAYLSKLFL